MSKKLISLFIIFVSINDFIFSQNSSNYLAANVNLIMPLSVTTINGQINFREIILTGSTMEINLSPQFGSLFRIEGHPGRSVTINFSVQNLTNINWVNQFGGTVGQLVFTPSVVTTGSSPDYLLPKSVSNGGSINLVNSNGIGIAYLWVGGTISISSNQPQGDYEGIFNLTVSY